MIEIKLPWPPTALSPNSRLHWAKVMKAKAAYRQQCWLMARAQLGPSVNVLLKGDSELALSIEFHPPQARRYDRDNLLARIKAGLDGMCDALAIDDHRFEPITVSMKKAPLRRGLVAIKIKPEYQQ